MKYEAVISGSISVLYSFIHSLEEAEVHSVCYPNMAITSQFSETGV